MNENISIPDNSELRIYFEGNEEESSRIVDEFKKVGKSYIGENFLCNDCRKLYYFIMYNDALKLATCDYDSITGALVKQVYKRGRLPHIPKEGEICVQYIKKEKRVVVKAYHSSEKTSSDKFFSVQDINNVLKIFIKDCAEYQPSDKEFVCAYNKDSPAMRVFGFYDALHRSLYTKEGQRNMKYKACYFFDVYEKYEQELPEWALQAEKMLDL